jgi:hypothetical protein
MEVINLVFLFFDSPNSVGMKNLCLAREIRGLFAKFVDSLYYSESELCGGAVTVSFSNNFP